MHILPGIPSPGLSQVSPTVALLFPWYVALDIVAQPFSDLFRLSQECRDSFGKRDNPSLFSSYPVSHGSEYLFRHRQCSF
jgi:hypothetical protein